MATLPTLTKLMDNAFLQTWYSIRKEAIDNILNELVVWAALKAKGCFVKKVGGDMITRTIKYAKTTDQVVGASKGDTLPMGEVETETMAWWPFRHLVHAVQQSTWDDQKNAGEDKIKDYLAQRIEETREGLVEKFDLTLFRTIDTTETAHKFPQSLNDLVPPFASRAAGTYGHIDRSNTWWQNKYKQWTSPRELNMVTDMRNLFNTLSLGRGQDTPNLIISDQTTFELYEEFGLDTAQAAKPGKGSLLDLGFDVLKFKGADWVWVNTGNYGASETYTAGDTLMLNCRHIEFVYDPRFWFQMSAFKAIPNQLERVAHVLCTGNLLGTKPRKQGRLYI